MFTLFLDDHREVGPTNFRETEPLLDASALYSNLSHRKMDPLILSHVPVTLSMKQAA